MLGGANVACASLDAPAIDSNGRAYLYEEAFTASDGLGQVGMYVCQLEVDLG